MGNNQQFKVIINKTMSKQNAGVMRLQRETKIAVREIDA